MCGPAGVARRVLEVLSRRSGCALSFFQQTSCPLAQCRRGGAPARLISHAARARCTGTGAVTGRDTAMDNERTQPLGLATDDVFGRAPMRTALITGASRGLGRALAVELARRGWNLILDGRDAARLRSVRDEL